MIRQYFATPRRTPGTRSTPPAHMLDEFAQAAKHTSDISNVSIRKSSVVFNATAEAIDKLRAQFGSTFIIEPERYLDPLP